MRKVALVTGAGSGIGAACCRHLASEGYAVAAADLRIDAAAQTVSLLDGAGHAAFGVDVTSAESVAAMFDRAEFDVGRIGALVCSAGGTANTDTHRPSFWQVPIDEWDWTQSVNCRGAFLCMREFARRRVAEPVPDARIVAISSVAGRASTGITGAAYATSKAAVLGLVRAVARELAPHGITANAVAPGPVDTPGFHRTNVAGLAGTVARSLPLGRIGKPEEIAATVGFILSPDAGFMTGATVDVNGGMLMQ